VRLNDENGGGKAGIRLTSGARMTDLFISHLSITGPHYFPSASASINLFGKFSTLLNNNNDEN
jgi:hypothetical protein